MRSVKIFILLFLPLVFSCKQSNEKEELTTDSEGVSQLEERKHVEMQKEGERLASVMKEEQEGPKFAGYPISFYLAHKQIPQVCKDVYTKKRTITDDSDILALMDSIFTTNTQTRPFYFLTLTQTMKEADGAYAEPLGTMAKEFVENNSEEFLDYFINEKMLTDENFEEWANTLAGEIKIIAEGEEKEEAEDVKMKMKKNCRNCSEQELQKLNDFVKRLKKECFQ